MRYPSLGVSSADRGSLRFRCGVLSLSFSAIVISEVDWGGAFCWAGGTLYGSKDSEILPFSLCLTTSTLIFRSSHSAFLLPFQSSCSHLPRAPSHAAFNRLLVILSSGLLAQDVISISHAGGYCSCVNLSTIN